ncbi:MAG: sugar phosphate isomerase/epimerase family protein, partial [Eubacteriales bacterium]
INVSDFNRTVAGAYRKVVTDSIKTAKKLSAPSLNMHLSRGVYFTLPDGKVYLFDIYREQYLDSMKRLREDCEKEIGGEEIKICVENTSGYTGFQLEALDILLESEVFALTYDIGHDYCAGGADGEVIMNKSDRLRHFHIHDAQGKQNHLTFGEGELDLNKYFAIAKKYGCRAVIEVKTADALRKSVNLIKTSKIQL